MQRRRDRHDIFGPVAVAPRAGDPDVHLAHGADRASLDEFQYASVIVGGMDLSAHLSDDAGLGGGLGNRAGLPNIMGEGLFAIDVLAEVDGGQDGKSVRVLSAGHDHGVNVIAGVVKLAEVHELPGLGILHGGCVETILVDVAKSDDVLAADFGGIRGPTTAGEVSSENIVAL